MTDEIAQLRRKVAELETSGLHTCHDECPRLACVQGREIRRLRAALKAIAVRAGTFEGRGSYIAYVELAGEIEKMADAARQGGEG
jgi:hypothetical protein